MSPSDRKILEKLVHISLTSYLLIFLTSCFLPFAAYFFASLPPASPSRGRFSRLFLMHYYTNIPVYQKRRSLHSVRDDRKGFPLPVNRLSRLSWASSLFTRKAPPQLSLLLYFLLLVYYLSASCFSTSCLSFLFFNVLTR